MSIAELHVLADVHGHRAELAQALRDEGLVDEAGAWSGGGARLWFLGQAVAGELAGTDAAGWLAFCGRMSDRGAFRDAEPAKPDDSVSTMLRTLGGDVLVHGHSTLTKHFGVAPEDVREAIRYADGRVLAIDGGVYEGGRILLTRLL